MEERIIFTFIMELSQRRSVRQASPWATEGETILEKEGLFLSIQWIQSLMEKRLPY